MELFPLISVSSERVSLYNTIVGRRRSASFKLGEEDCQFSFVADPYNYQPTVFFKVKLSDHHVWLILEKLPALAIFSKDLEDILLEELPSEFQPVVLEALAEPVLDNLEERLGVLLSIEHFQKTLPEELPEELLEFRLRYKNGQISGRLAVDPIALEFLEALMGKRYTQDRSLFKDITVPLHVIAGSTKVPLTEFKKLKLKDLLLFDAGNFLENGNCRVVAGGKMIFDANLDQGHVTLNQLIDMIDEENDPQEFEDEEEDFMGDRDDADTTEGESDNAEFSEKPEALAEEEAYVVDEPEEGEGIDVGKLPINLAFEVGQKRVSLAELRSIQAGYTFELTNPVQSPVTIRANGRVVGEGELLKIGDRVGVRVSRLKNHA